MSQDNPDIRQQVDDNRGPQKKLEMLIPGLRGYRTLEDLRVSDSLLRNQVADKLDASKANLEGLRKQMATAGDFTNLTAVGSLISQIQGMSGVVRHAQQGYSGFVATISINQDKLNKLYENDYAFVSSAVQLQSLTTAPALVYDTTAPNSIQIGLSKVTAAISDFNQKWSVRMESVENILVQ
ncbi:MAG: hypothetical protein OK456_01840 [Thaumarchaeota archaeon]|nr:hypothetical protein [Nitrososphaerota archaeon]